MPEESVATEKMREVTLIGGPQDGRRIFWPMWMKYMKLQLLVGDPAYIQKFCYCTRNKEDSTARYLHIGIREQLRSFQCSVPVRRFETSDALLARIQLTGSELFIKSLQKEHRVVCGHIQFFIEHEPGLRTCLVTCMASTGVV